MDTSVAEQIMAERIMRAINSSEVVHCVLASLTSIDCIQSQQVNDTPGSFISG